MGSSNWSASDYTSYSRSVSGKKAAEIFTNVHLHPDLDPKKIKVRESVDSKANPQSTPIIVGCDDTGSMGRLAEDIIKRGLGILVQGIIDRKPVTDPHVMLAAIGDAYCDSAPLQVTQFEADVVLCKQIEKFYIEQGGGGNNGEGYALLWWFAQNKTKCDAINLRNKKGYIFTIGDECYLPEITKGQINEFLGGSAEKNVDVKDLLKEVQKDWNVFHIIVPTEATRSQDAIKVWKDLLGERAIVLEDEKKLSEVIVSIMQVNEGHKKKDILKWDKSTNLVVSKVIEDLGTLAVHDSSKTAEIVNI